MRDRLKAVSRPWRHWVVKKIAPKLYFAEDNRPMLEELKKLEGPLIGCEIGVGEGRNAEQMLETLDIQMLYLVDPVDSRRMRRRLVRFRDDYMFWKLTSDEAAGYFLNGGLDFVYIDGDHSYGQVRRDILNYWFRVRSGGILGGHDFFGDYVGVARAVVKFVERRRLELHGGFLDWWVVKP